MGARQYTHKRAVFLDRDGVINRNVWNPVSGAYEAPLTADQFELCDGALAAMRQLRSASYELFLVSNQPNYAKGKASLETLDLIHARLTTALSDAEIQFAAFYYCLHHPEGVIAANSGRCECRKPSPHFLLKAKEDFCIDLKQSWMIGDRISDIECGKAAGAKTVFICTYPFDKVAADFQAHDLCEAVSLILEAD
jgi:D-glycero-D-manno-heptose 1,7-bisphosphate phosphatase